MTEKTDRKPSAHLIRTISVRAFADPRTVARFLRGETVRSLSEARIKDAVAKLRAEGVVVNEEAILDG